MGASSSGIPPPLPDYLAGVLAGELYPDSPPESLRALAILARSFALAHLEDLTDDPGQHQAYRGVPAATALPALRAAVASTEGLRLVSGDGKPLPGYWYHSTCGGHTADASIVFGAPPTPAYAGVACPHCTESKYYQWETEMPEALVRKALGLQEGVTGLSVVRRSPDGRARTLQARLKGGTARESAALSLRSALGPNLIRSTRLSSIESIPGDVQGGPVPRAFRFRGRGWGHGVGLCQIGAMTMARAGCPAEEILAFYYPGSRLVRVDR
jgi:stage II sporulation protein D